jgi:HAD superfamily hydrolase (TIGR01509 family)
MSGEPYDVVLFDLGGVLVRLDGVPQMQAMSRIEREDELWRRWLGCPWVRTFERGRCSPDEFAAGVVDEWGLDISPHVFLERFRGWPVALIDGAVELVKEVGAHCRIGCLSNTNELHWDVLVSRWGLGDLFEEVFLSFRLDLVKPDPEVFAHVCGALGLPPGRILFLDDNALNVDRARSVGLAGAVVRGTAEARTALVDHGVLPDAGTHARG